MSELLNLFNQSYFWDVDPAKLDIVKSKHLIIGRIFSLGNQDDIRNLMKLYTENEIEESLVNQNYLDPKTLNFVSLFFGIPKSRFKCYTKKQSTPAHWNY